MKKYLIVCGGEIGLSFLKKEITNYAPDFIIAADSGFDSLKKISINADLLIGDMDSVTSDIKGYEDNIIKLNTKKDETDTDFAVNTAIEKGAKDILIMPGVASRFDHSYANVLLLRRTLKKGVKCRIKNENNEMFVKNKAFEINDKIGQTVSFFAFETTVITLKGFCYPLDGYVLKSDDSIGVSNVIKEKKAMVEFIKGEVLAIFSKD